MASSLLARSDRTTLWPLVGPPHLRAKGDSPSAVAQQHLISSIRHPCVRVACFAQTSEDLTERPRVPRLRLGDALSADTADLLRSLRSPQRQAFRLRPPERAIVTLLP